MKLLEEINELLSPNQELSIIDKILKSKESSLKDLYFAYSAALSLLKRRPKKKLAIEKRIQIAKNKIKTRGK